MSRILGVVLPAFAAAFVMFGISAPARAGCVEFQETDGDAMLINHCSVEMNVGYFVGADGQALDPSQHLFRSTVAADGTKVLWSRGGAPVAGKYAIKVFSCMAPTNLVYQPGQRPTCQIAFADAG